MLDIDLALGKEIEADASCRNAEGQIIICPVCREESCPYTIRLRR